MDIRYGVSKLRQLIQLIAENDLHTKSEFHAWAKANDAILEEIFDYVRKDGMPAIHTLFKAFFHPKYPLIGLNYTPVAHNTLHEHPEGWTTPLRLCRGIVFERTGRLLGIAYAKFFNHGEMPETINLPDEEWIATEKMDGHLGIIFEYNGELIVTSRGDFTSRTSVLATEMLAAHLAKNPGMKTYMTQTKLREVTILTEIIHPDTHVLTDYGDEKKFVLTGAYNRETFEDCDYAFLDMIAPMLVFDITKRWSGFTLDDLVAHMKDRSVTNKEGYVIRFKSGLRVKVKYQTYIGKMVEAKLHYTYLMNRVISGNLDKMIETLDEEIYNVALQMLGRIFLCLARGTTPREKWQNLYELVDPDDRTSYYQGVCREFVKKFLEVSPDKETLPKATKAKKK